MEGDEKENGDEKKIEDKEKQLPGEEGGMPPAPAEEAPVGPGMAEVVALLNEVIGLLKGTTDMTKEKDEAGAAEVESPNEKDTATPDSGKTGGTPQDQVATTLSEETALNKSMLYSMAKENVLKEQKIEALEKQLASVDKGNVGSTRDPSGTPPVTPPTDPNKSLPGAENLEDKQKSAIKDALHGDGKYVDYTKMPAGVN